MSLRDSTASNPGRPETERWVLLVSALASGMAFIDATALNIALPAIQTDLGASGTQLLWIVNAYALIVASLLLSGGALGDRHGHRRVLATGVALFAVASLLCGAAPSVEALIAARALQGLGAACMLPGSLSLIATTFPESRRGRAIGIWSALCVVMTVIGPLLGGVFAQAGLWRGVFFINLPLAGACLVILRKQVPADVRPGDTHAPAFDVAGGLLSVVGMAAFSYGLIESTNRTWRDPLVLCALAISVLCLVLFLRAERRATVPLLPLSLMSDRLLIGASLMTLCFYSGVFGMTFFLSLNLVQVQFYRPIHAGLALAPLMLMVLLLSPVAGRLADRKGLRLPVVIGGCLGSLGFLLLAMPGITNGPEQYWSSYFPALLLLGMALGLCAAPLSTAIVNSAARQNVGTAAGINAMLSRVSSVLGIAILGPVALQVFQSTLLSDATVRPLTTRQLSVLRSEAVNLAAASPPADLPSDLSRAVGRTIRRSYVTAFRAVTILSAVAVGLSTIAAVWLFPAHRDLC